MQSKKMSLIESLTNIAIGFGINLTANFFIFPLFGYEITLKQNVDIGIWFTFVSLARSYCIRRWFTRR